MKKIFLLALAAAALGACDSQPKFTVEGTVTDADGKMLYLEASALDGIQALDSVKLGSNGSFNFQANRPASPEFYRLRLEDKVINFAVDSTETIRFNTQAAGFDTKYQVEGSANSLKIQELTIKQMGLQARINALIAAMQANKLGATAFQDSVANVMKAYKDEVKLQYIFAAPNTSAAYFALFQKLNNYLIFDPLNSKEDVKCFAAVATSLNNRYPEADRTKNLYNIVIKGMKNTRQPQQANVEIPAEKVTETGIIDINLRDLKGNSRKLSDLKGKAVILDFTIYQSAVSAAHNYQLLDLYNKYHAQGLEVYQVSLDADEHFWMTTADNLPWVCVRDANGVYSQIAVTYNVQNVPSIFLVSKQSELKARGENIKDLEAAVKELL